MRRMRRMDGRNPYGSRGGYVTNRRPRMRGRDRAMDGNYDMRRDMPYSQDMRNQGYDGHYPQGKGSTYYPVQAMGTFEGYYGMPEQDYGYDMRSGRGRMDYARDMRGRGGRGNDYGYDYGYDYGDDYGDYGETLTEEELDHWSKKLMSNFDEREKQLFHKDTIMQRIKAMGKSMEGFGEKELYVATLMCYSDYKNTIGQNVDVSIKLAYDWLADKDVAVKGAEKLAVYYDCIVEGEDD